MFWVTMLGTKEEAKQYDVIMSIPRKSTMRCSMELRADVFSTDEVQEDIIKDELNVLRMDHRLGEPRTDGDFNIYTVYHIIRK